MANKKENASRLLAGGRQNIAAEVKKQSGINGLLPALGAGPFHLFRLHLDLRCDVLKKVTVTFPSEKVFSQRRPFGSQTLVVAQCRGGNLPAGKHAKIRSAARYRESLAQFIVSQLDQFLLASSLKTPWPWCAGAWRGFARRPVSTSSRCKSRSSLPRRCAWTHQRTGNASPIPSRHADRACSFSIL